MRSETDIKARYLSRFARGMIGGAGHVIISRHDIRIAHRGGGGEPASTYPPPPSCMSLHACMPGLPITHACLPIMWNAVSHPGRPGGVL